MYRGKLLRLFAVISVLFYIILSLVLILLKEERLMAVLNKISNVYSVENSFSASDSRVNLEKNNVVDNECSLGMFCFIILF